MNGLDYYSYNPDELRITRLMQENRGLREQVAGLFEQLSEEQVRVEELRNIIDRMIERMIEAGVG